MAKDDKPTLAPRLRFPEFRNALAWARRRLSDFMTERNEYPDQPVPLFSLTIENGVTPKTERYERSFLVTDEKAAYKLMLPDDFAFNPMNLRFGAIGRHTGTENVSVSKYYNIFFCDASTDAKFCELYLKSDVMIAYYDNMAIGSLIEKRRVHFNDFLKFEIGFPSLAEQQKIADCLTSLDAVVAAQGRKVEALKAHKKGLMQQLFPRAGETLPRLRFPEFRDAGNWQETTLGEIAEVKLGKMLDREKHKTGRLLPYLNNISLRWNEVDTSNLPGMYFDDDELDRFGLKAGDVVVCEGGEPGRSAVWDGRLPDLKFQKAIHRVRFNVPFEPRFLVLYLEAIAGTTQFEMLFTGAGIRHLTRETFARLRIPLLTLPEQQRIADCLSTRDARIAAEADKLAALKTHKKALMQQLFPSPEAV